FPDINSGPVARKMMDNGRGNGFRCSGSGRWNGGSGGHIRGGGAGRGGGRLGADLFKRDPRRLRPTGVGRALAPDPALHVAVANPGVGGAQPRKLPVAAVQVPVDPEPAVRPLAPAKTVLLGI